MDFKKSRISDSSLKKIRDIISKSDSPATNQKNSSSPSDNLPTYLKYGTIFAGLLIIVGLIWLTVSMVKSLDFSSLIFSFGKQLKTDPKGYTNFILTGTGGAEHDGGNLTDTIMIVSLNPETKTVKMLSFPRDLYIEDKTIGGQRINKIYDTYYRKFNRNPQEGMRKLADTVTSLTGVPIQYTIKVDFEGFVKIIDALGGITVDVEKAIHDPFYPLGETEKYQTFNISAGIQKLDGETALKYARSRKTTSDFDRAKRQQQIIAAVKEQALNINLLTDPGKLQKLYESVADSIQTNLTVPEILELAKIAKEIDRGNIQSRVLSDDFTSCGGLLYTPNRDYFGGASVLLPAGNEFDETKRFTQNYFYSDTQINNPIQVLNATKTSGLAYKYLNRLSRDCLEVIYYGNAANREQEKSVIYYNKDQNGNIPSAISIIKGIIDAPVLEGIPAEYLATEKRAPAQIVIEIGADYKSITSADPFNKLLYTTPLETPETETAGTGAEPIAIRGDKTTSEVSNGSDSTTPSVTANSNDKALKTNNSGSDNTNNKPIK